MCFAATGKGLVAIAIQSFATAHRLGILSELQEHLRDYFPNTADLAAKGLVSMPPKTYRWIREMQEIADTLNEEGARKTCFLVLRKYQVLSLKTLM